MRKVILGLIVGTALALGSTANAAVTVIASSNLNSPNPATDPTAVQTVGGTTTITFGQNPEPSGSFSGSFDLTNSNAGLYSVLLGSSTPGVTFSAASLMGIDGSVGTYPFAGAGTNIMTLAQTLIGTGTYRLSFTGNNPQNSGVMNGNVTIMMAIPEPGTWALMLLGFGAMGLAMRRNRLPGFAQLA